MKEREGEREKEAERDAESAARGVKAKEMESSWTQDSKKENIEWGEHLHMYEETYFLYSIVLTTISQARDIVVSTIYYNQQNYWCVIVGSTCWCLMSGRYILGLTDRQMTYDV